MEPTEVAMRFYSIEILGETSVLIQHLNETLARNEVIVAIDGIIWNHPDRPADYGYRVIIDRRPNAKP